MTVLLARGKKPMWGRVPNLITLSRVVLTCVVNYYIRSRFGEIGLPLLILGLIFLTDYLDGKIARTYGTVSPGGAVLDLLADFFFMFLSYLVLHSFGIVPLWFIGVVFGKFLEFVLTSIYIKRFRKGSPVFIFDRLGRFVAAAFYLLPALLYSSHHLSPAIYTFCINKLTYIISFFSLISSAYRIRRCCRRRRLPGQNKETDQKEPEPNPVPAEGFEVIFLDISQKKTDGNHRNDKGGRHSRKQNGQLQPAEMKAEFKQL